MLTKRSNSLLEKKQLITRSMRSKDMTESTLRNRGHKNIRADLMAIIPF